MGHRNRNATVSVAQCDVAVHFIEDDILEALFVERRPIVLRPLRPPPGITRLTGFEPIGSQQLAKANLEGRTRFSAPPTECRRRKRRFPENRSAFKTVTQLRGCGSHSVTHCSLASLGLFRLKYAVRAAEPNAHRFGCVVRY